MVDLNKRLVDFLTEFDSDYPDWTYYYTGAGKSLLNKDFHIGI